MARHIHIGSGLSNGLDLYDFHPPFSLADLKEVSSNGLYRQIEGFFKAHYNEPEPLFVSIGQFMKVAECVVAYNLLDRQEDRYVSEPKKDNCRTQKKQIVEVIGSLTELGLERMLTKADFDKMTSLSRDFPTPFPASKRFPKGNSSFWDAMKDSVLRDVVKSVFAGRSAHEDDSSLLLSTSDREVEVDGGEFGQSYSDALESTCRLLQDRQTLASGGTLSEDSPLPIATLSIEPANADFNSSLTVLFYSGNIPRNLPRSVIPVEFSPWDYPIIEGRKVLEGTAWEAMAGEIATNIINAWQKEKSLPREGIALEFTAQGGVLKAYPKDEVALFMGHLLDSLVEPRMEFQSRDISKGGRSRNLTIRTDDLDGTMNITSVVLNAQTLPVQSIVGTTLSHGFDTVIVNSPIAMGRIKRDFVKSFPKAGEIQGRYVQTRQRLTQRATEAREALNSRLDFESLHQNDRFAPIVPSYRPVPSGGDFAAESSALRDSDIILYLSQKQGAYSGYSLSREMLQDDEYKLIRVYGLSEAKSLAKEISRQMEGRGFPKENLHLSICGDTLWDLKKALPQESIDKLLSDTLLTLQTEYGVHIKEIRISSKDGVALSGARAAMTLGVPMSVFHPSDFSYTLEHDRFFTHKVCHEWGFKERYSCIAIRPEAVALLEQRESEGIKEASPINLDKPYDTYLYGERAKLPMTLEDIAKRTSNPIILSTQKYLGSVFGEKSKSTLISVDHTIDLVLATFGHMVAKTDYQKTGCAAIIDGLTRTPVTHEEIDAWENRAKDAIDYKAVMEVLDKNNNIHELLHDVTLSGYMLNADKAMALLSDTREITGQESDMVEILKEVKEELPRLIKEERERIEAERQERVRALMEEKSRAKGDYPLPPHIARITEEDEGFQRVYNAWMEGQSCLTDSVLTESGAYSLANRHTQSSGDEDDRGVADQWEFNPNRFYLTRKDGNFYIEAARFVEESGFGEYVNTVGEETLNHDCIRVRKCDREAMDEVFNIAKLPFKIEKGLGF